MDFGSSSRSYHRRLSCRSRKELSKIFWQERILPEVSVRTTVFRRRHLSHHWYYSRVAVPERGQFILQIILLQNKVLLTFVQSLPGTKREKIQSDDESGVTQTEEELPGMRSLLTRRVCLTLTNYAMLAFTSIANAGIFPLFLFTPIHLGGLGFSEAQVRQLKSPI